MGPVDVKKESYMVKNNHEIFKEMMDQSLAQQGDGNADGVLNPELQGKKDGFCNPEMKYPVQK